MIFQPVLNPLLILLLCAPVAALAIWVLVRPPRTAGGAPADTRTVAGHRALWAMRLVLVLACATLLLRPGIPGGATQTLATDTDIVLVVDTTASIVAEDWATANRGSTASVKTCARSSRSTQEHASRSSPRMRRPS